MLTLMGKQSRLIQSPATITHQSSSGATIPKTKQQNYNIYLLTLFYTPRG